MADAQLQPWSSVLLALLCRGLVATYLSAGTTQASVPSAEFLDANLWHGARSGMDGELVHPFHETLVPAAEAVQVLLDAISRPWRPAATSQLSRPWYGSCRLKVSGHSNNAVGTPSADSMHLPSFSQPAPRTALTSRAAAGPRTSFKKARLASALAVG